MREATSRRTTSEFPRYLFQRDISHFKPNTSVKMSRFFTAGDSSSESSSEDEQELYSDEELRGAQKSNEDSDEDSDEGGSDEDDSSSSDEGGPSGASKFLREAGESDSDSDDEKVKVVKSAKKKRFEELEGVIKTIENALKINDWSIIAAGKLRMPSSGRVADFLLQNLTS